MKRNILLCVAGATPQIITETLYDLTIQQGKTIDEIRVITTLEGRDKIMTGFIKGRPGGSAEESLLDSEHGKFFKFLQHYSQVGEIEFNEKKIALLRTRDGQTLEDIRTPEENELAGDQICEIVREICKDENTQIFASAAGGRKTMSIYLTLAMSLFGRAEDELSHVLVNSDFEMHPQFFYPTPTPEIIKLRDGREVSTETAEIYLAPIPFIRLRGIGAENEKFGQVLKYSKMVTEAQKVLDIREKEYDLFIDTKSLSAFVRGQKIKLPRRQFFFYLMFIRRKLKNEGVISLKSLTRSDFDSSLHEILLATKSEDVDLEEIDEFPQYRFAKTMLAQLESGRDKDFSDFRGEFSKVITLIGNHFKSKGVDSRYYPVTTDDGTASYCIKISAERIDFAK